MITREFLIRFGASSRTRTNDRWITNLVLYQLSYRGALAFGNKIAIVHTAPLNGQASCTSALRSANNLQFGLRPEGIQHT